MRKVAPAKPTRAKAKRAVESDARKAKRLGFRSGGEMHMTTALKEAGVTFLYEERSLIIPYIIPESNHKYLPDFFLKKLDGTIMYIDYKGKWELDDRNKHYLIQEQHPNLDIRIIFERDPAKQYIGAPRRSSSYADICTKGCGRGKWREFSLPFSFVKRVRGLPPRWIPQKWLAECEVSK